MYYGARYYAADLGRFAQPDSIVPDPYNPQSLNPYSYGLNNPVRYKDRSGHIPIDWLIDFFSVAFDVQQFVSEPSWENAGWLAVDVVLGVVPYVPAGAGPLAKGAKAGEEITKAGKVAEKALESTRDVSKIAGAGTKSAEELASHGIVAGAEQAGRTLTRETIEHLAAQGTHLGENKVTVIGRWNPSTGKNYIDAAKDARATFFDLGKNGTGYTREQVLDIEREFFKSAIERGDTIKLGTVGDFDKGGTLIDEIQLLKDEFGLVLEGDVFVHP